MYIVKIIGIVFFVVGIVFAITTIVMKISFSKKKKLYIGRVMATVVDIKKDIKIAFHDVSQKVYTCFNCYQYEANGKVYKEWSNTGCIPGKFTVGDIVELHYNNDNPKQFYVEKENNKGINTIFVLVSIALIVGSILLFYISSNF